MFVHVFWGVIHIKLCFGTAFTMVVSHGSSLFVYKCPVLHWNHEFHAATADDIAIYNFDLVFAGVAGFEDGGTVGGL